jgi:hypothetical protein
VEWRRIGGERAPPEMGFGADADPLAQKRPIVLFCIYEQG